MDYLLLKWVHIISSTILFGTGIGSAFFMFMANRRKEIYGIYFATRHVVIADWLFTAPAVIVQFVTGFMLAHITGYSLTEGWLIISIILYSFVGLCWLPVVWMQIKMRNIAKISYTKNLELPPKYWRLDKWWTILGSIAFPLVLIIFYLMIFRPNITLV